MRGFARVGLIALIDEATGYQEIRAKRDLATILEKFIAKELQPWTRTFPYEFYEQICRLKGWPSINAVKRPSVIGKYTNDFVYERLAPGVLEELKRVNPKLPSGVRRHKHHQWFTPEHGPPETPRAPCVRNHVDESVRNLERLQAPSESGFHEAQHDDTSPVGWSRTIGHCRLSSWAL